MTKNLYILFLLPLIWSCTQQDATSLNVLKNCQDDHAQYVASGGLVNDLFLCKRDTDAFDLITSQEPKFKNQDYAVTGEILLNHHQVGMAISYLSIAADQGNAIASEQLGGIYAYKHEYKDIAKAIYFLEKALQYGDAHPALLLAYIYLEEEDYIDLKKALYYAEYAIQHNENIGYFYQGRVFAEQAKYDLAIESFKQIDPKKYAEYKDVGFADLYAAYPQFKGHDPQRAKQILEQLLKTSSNPDRFAWLADFYLHDHQYQDKQKAYQLHQQGAKNGSDYSHAFVSVMPKN